MKIFFVGVISAAMLLTTPLHTFAANGDTGTATVYKVTVTTFEMNNGSEWVTVSDGSSTQMDIASVDSGQAVGNLFAGLTVPDGNYTQVRVTIQNSFTISGSVGTDGTPVYTTAATADGACVGTADSNAEAACTVSVPEAFWGDPMPDNLPTTLVVSNGVPSHKIRVNFDISAAITENGAGNLYPGNPTVTMEMIPL
jgi:hypothetical protein